MDPSETITNENTQVLDLKKLFRAPDEETHMDDITNPYSLRSWWNSIQALEPEDYKERAKLYYRALYFLPGSYKLWYNFLLESRQNCKRYSLSSKRYEIINCLFEKALVYMNKMPKIWLDYCKFLGRQKFITRTRQTYDRALKSLPLPQHDVVWSRYMSWTISLEDLDIIKNTYSRYIKFMPTATEELIDLLLDYGDVQGAVEMYIGILNNENYSSKKGLSQYQLWMHVCELISKHPDKLDLPNAEKIIRHGVRKYTDEVGKLWICLADYNTRIGQFEKAREIFEEAIASVVTARDFGIIFNAYMNFEEAIIEKDAEYTETDTEFEDQLDKLIDGTLNCVEDRKTDEQLSSIDKNLITEQDEEDYKYFKLENLIQRRPFLLSNTNLRQNPSNVYEWLNRVQLWEDNEELKIQTYLEAIWQIDPKNAYGKASKVWIEFANFYEEHGDLKNANEIYKRAIKIDYRGIEELASVYCAWAELHLKHKNYDSALAILSSACSSKRDKKGPKIDRENSLHMSPKIWFFFADLQESIGSFDEAKLVYERMMDLKVATPHTILNYCAFLEKHYYFEESFRIYERSLSVFQWPHCYDLWVIYLSKFIERYADAKVERTRDLFEQVLNKCPKDHENVSHLTQSIEKIILLHVRWLWRELRLD